MTENYFTVRSRLREVRSAVRRDRDVQRAAAPGDLLFRFFEELARNVGPVEAGRADKFHHVIRCMGEVVKHHAETAYEPYGLENPFRKAPAPPTTAVPSAVASRTFAATWPVIRAQAPRTGAAMSLDSFADRSALKMFGYTVGKNGWNTAKRRRFLGDFMEMQLPRIVGDTFGDDYGEPGSLKRLLKMANVIAGVANMAVQKNNWNMVEAIADWTDDLAFLEAQYYRAMKGSPLLWPAIPARRLSA